MKYLAGLAAALALFAEGALAQDRVELAPYSNWVADYADDSCALQRQFGEEGRQAFLELRMFGSRQGMQVIIASKDFERRNGDFKVAFEPLEQEALVAFGFDMQLGAEYEGKLFSYALGESDPRAYAAEREFTEAATIITDEQRRLVLRSMDLERMSPALERLSRNQDYQTGSTLVNAAFLLSEAWQDIRNRMEAEVEGILIEDAFDDTLFLRTGSLHAPMEAMRTCLDELASHWGIDVEAHRTLTRPVIPLEYARLAREVSRDYPSRMARAGMEGYLRVRVDVSADGKPTACHMQSPINDEAFERVACANMMRHAKFSPALDRQAQPIASVYQTAIIYLNGR